MSNELEYELIQIEWQLDYADASESHGLSVKEDVTSSDSASSEAPAIEYDANGIPMGTTTEDMRIRKQLIFEFYERWKENHPDRAVFNTHIHADILIRQESIVEAAGHASKRYKSTLAVFRLDEVLAGAIQVDTDLPKPGNKNQQKLVRMLLMSYNCPDIGTIKLTVGVRRRSLDKIQYGITALNEGENIVPEVGIKAKKTPHKK